MSLVKNRRKKSNCSINMNVETVITNHLLDTVDIDTSSVVLKLVGDVTTLVGTILHDNLLAADKANLPVIPLVIHSGGGDMEAMLLIIHAMEQCTTPIATYCYGMAASAAAVIFCYGSNGHRYMAPHSYLMFHEYSLAVEHTKGSDIKAVHTHMSQIESSINRKIERHIGLEKGFFSNLGHVDFYMNAKDAQTCSIADHIGYPRITITCSVNIEIACNKKRKIDDEFASRKYHKIVVPPIQPICIEEGDDE